MKAYQKIAYKGIGNLVHDTAMPYEQTSLEFIFLVNNIEENGLFMQKLWAKVTIFGKETTLSNFIRFRNHSFP